MPEALKVAIVLARCNQGLGTFGIRYEQSLPRRWDGVWAFAIKEASAKREGYDRNIITGAIAFGDAYPGCPYCSSPSIFRCGKCATVSCWDTTSQTVICPGCGIRDKLRGDVDALESRSDA